MGRRRGLGPEESSGSGDRVIKVLDTGTSRPSLIQGGWRFWEHVMVRSAGFPVHSVAAFADDQLAGTADSVDDTDPNSRTAYEHRWREYDTIRQAALTDVLGRSDFTLALTWQNSRLLQTAIGPLVDQIARGEPRSRKRRLR